MTWHANCIQGNAEKQLQQKILTINGEKIEKEALHINQKRENDIIKERKTYMRMDSMRYEFLE